MTICVPTELNEVVREAVAPVPVIVLPFWAYAMGVTGTVQELAVPQGEKVTVPVGPAPRAETGGKPEPGSEVNVPITAWSVTV